MPLPALRGLVNRGCEDVIGGVGLEDSVFGLVEGQQLGVGNVANSLDGDDLHRTCYGHGPGLELGDDIPAPPPCFSSSSQGGSSGRHDFNDHEVRSSSKKNEFSLPCPASRSINTTCLGSDGDRRNRPASGRSDGHAGLGRDHIADSIQGGMLIFGRMPDPAAVGIGARYITALSHQR